MAMLRKHIENSPGGIRGAGHKQAATGLRVAKQVFVHLAGIALDHVGDRVPVAARSAGLYASLGMAAVPLLLFLVGTTFDLSNPRLLLIALPALVVKLVGGAAAGYFAASALGLEGELLGATVITAAAPSIAVGIALSERFKLDSALFSTVMTLTTVGYVLIAPYLQQAF